MTASRTRISNAELALHLACATAREARRLRRLLGRGEGWLALPAAAWRRAGLPDALVDRLAAARSSRVLEEARAAYATAGIRLVSARDATSPPSLRPLHRPPVLLAVRGRWPPPADAVALVGARAATAYGRQVARDLAGAISDQGLGVVSGLARGIDRWALEAALERGGWPIAVLGCGLDIAYPRENRRLQDAIARAGTVISEFPLGRRPDRWTFPRRNRIIAALARATVVVEAGGRSGSLITAEHALELGRDVLAVPGPIDSELSRGANRLILDGAAPVLGASELLDQLGLAPSAAVRPAAADDDPLLAALQQGLCTPDELAHLTNSPVGEVRSRLIGLELGGRVVREHGDRYRAR